MNPATTDRFMGAIVEFVPGAYRAKKIDELCWSVEKLTVVGAASAGKANRRKPKAENVGSIRWIPLAQYHPTLGLACKYLARHLADEGDKETVLTLEYYADRLNRIGEEIEEACNAVTGEGKSQ